MGGMAIMLAFTDAKVLRVVAQRGKPDSAFMKVIASFFHFILIQTLAIFGALISKAYSSDVVSIIGTFLFLYGVLVGLATAGQLLQTARIFNAIASFVDDDSSKDKK